MDTTRFNVLLVDDEPDFLYPLVRRLTRRNLIVESAGSGPTALEIIARKPVDVVVLDVKMPGMGGLEILRAIKANHEEIEVILLSGHASIDTAMKGISDGAFDYLMKPVDFDELFFKLQDAYEKKSLREMRKAQGGKGN
jgi:DNA-binding NtrC family response regulator